MCHTFLDCVCVLLAHVMHLPMGRGCLGLLVVLYRMVLYSSDSHKGDVCHVCLGLACLSIYLSVCCLCLCVYVVMNPLSVYVRVSSYAYKCAVRACLCPCVLACVVRNCARVHVWAYL
jgi:hypothetical protein